MRWYNKRPAPYVCSVESAKPVIEMSVMRASSSLEIFPERAAELWGSQRAMQSPVATWGRSKEGTGAKPLVYGLGIFLPDFVTMSCGLLEWKEVALLEFAVSEFFSL